MIRFCLPVKLHIWYLFSAVSEYQIGTPRSFVFLVQFLPFILDLPMAPSSKKLSLGPSFPRSDPKILITEAVCKLLVVFISMVILMVYFDTNAVKKQYVELRMPCTFLIL